MTIAPNCAKCGKELEEFGALLFSPPTGENKVDKFHLCVDCFRSLQISSSVYKRTKKV